MSTSESDFPGVVEQVLQGDSSDSLLDQLAGKREAIAKNKETFIPVPGYDQKPPILLIRYRLMTGPELQLIGDKIVRESRDQWQRQLLSAVDIFIAACTGIYVDKGDPGSKPEPLTYNGEPIMGFTEELALALRYRDELPDPPPERLVVLGLFANNEVAITQHNFLLNRWSSNTSIDVRDEMYSGNR